jgi:hypothetical protein
MAQLMPSWVTQPGHTAISTSTWMRSAKSRPWLS